MASSTSSLNPVSRETIILTFQLQKFLISDHPYVDLLDKKIRQLIDHIVRNNFRSSFIFKEIKIFIRDERARARSNSIKPFSWPPDWMISKFHLWAALTIFNKNTFVFRRLQNPPSTRVTSHTSSIISFTKTITQRRSEGTSEKLPNNDLTPESVHLIETITLDVKSPTLQGKERRQFTPIKRSILSSSLSTIPFQGRERRQFIPTRRPILSPSSSTIRKSRSPSSSSFFSSSLQRRAIFDRMAGSNNDPGGFRNFSNTGFPNPGNNRTFNRILKCRKLWARISTTSSRVGNSASPASYSSRGRPGHGGDRRRQSVADMAWQELPSMSFLPSAPWQT